MKSQATLLGVIQPALSPESDLWRHAAVRPLADHEAPLAEHEAPRPAGRDFSRVPVHASGPDGGHAEVSCPLTPRRCPFGGACHTCPTQVQTKLAVNQPGDGYEQEADRMADQLTGASGGQLHCHAASPALPAGVPLIVHEVLRSPGHPLDANTRAFMEPRFGHDFSGVRVHSDTKAAESARAVNALAYTVGRDVMFGAGQYQPATNIGRNLMAHELTHMVQQRTAIPPLIQRMVRPENVTCRNTGLTNPNMTGADAVAAIQDADSEAIVLAQLAEDELDSNLSDVRAGGAVDADFDTILQEELGLTLTNPAHFRLIEQQRDRFRQVRETLESGYLRYMCRGGTVSLVGCTQGTCENAYAFSCPANRLVVLCQPFWDEPNERAATILHEPFHIWFHMAQHAANALRRADASCFESFARRVAGEAATASCVGHTAG